MDRLRPVRWVLAITLVAATIQATFAPIANAGASGTFLVVYKGTAVPSTAEARIQAAGGSLVYSYPQIGVAVATSDEASFGTTLRTSDSSVQGAVATAKFGTQLSDPGAAGDAGEPTIDPGTPAPGATTSPVCNGTWIRSRCRPLARSTAGARRCSWVTSTRGSTTRIPIWRRTSTSRTASHASAAFRIRVQPRGPTTTATARTLRARSRPRRTRSASSASRRR